MAILVVDDEKDARESLQELLSIAGYEAIGASSGEEALELLGGNNISLMLVDLSMPGMGGEEFIRRAMQVGCKASALAVTAIAPWQTAGLTGLGVGYLRKPYDGKVLLGTVKTLLNRGKRS